MLQLSPRSRQRIALQRLAETMLRKGNPDTRTLLSAGKVSIWRPRATGRRVHARARRATRRAPPARAGPRAGHRRPTVPAGSARGLPIRPLRSRCSTAAISFLSCVRRFTSPRRRATSQRSTRTRSSSIYTAGIRPAASRSPTVLASTSSVSARVTAAAADSRGRGPRAAARRAPLPAARVDRKRPRRHRGPRRRDLGGAGPARRHRHVPQRPRHLSSCPGSRSPVLLSVRHARWPARWPGYRWSRIAIGPPLSR
jgi:hypothetical protein